MGKLISGKDLMKLWNMGPHELLNRFIKQGLIAYNKTGQAVSPDDAIAGTSDQRSDIEKIEAWREYELPGDDAKSQQMIQALSNLYFDKINVQGIGKHFNLGGNKKGAKAATIHHTEIHKQRARAVATELWAGKYRKLSVPELIDTQEMLDVTLKSDGITQYANRTVKDWIKDLNPNPPLKGAPKKPNKK